jgi:hypothetical protein
MSLCEIIHRDIIDMVWNKEVTTVDCVVASD